MNARNVLIVLLCLFALVSSDQQNTMLKFNPLFISEIIHENAELGKVCLNTDESNTILSKGVDSNQGSTLISEIDNRGGFIYHNSKFNLVYDSSAQILEKKTNTEESAYLLYYKNNGKEYFTEFKDKGVDLQSSKDLGTLHTKVSSFTLKNGLIFFAGIQSASKYAKTNLNIKIYDAQTKTPLNTGITINAYSQLVSCAEVKDNEVYCAYIHDENLIKRHLLYLQHFKVTDNGEIIHEEQAYLIKSFYTDFNMVKVVKISETEVGIVFQTGNGNEVDNIPFGNTGKDLYFYHLEVSSNKMEVVRYDYIYNNCRLRDDTNDYTVDIISLPNKFIYAICESALEQAAFQLIQVYGPDKKFVQMTIGNLGKTVKNPVFVRIDDSAAILYTRIDTNNKKDVMLLKMNYPDCNDAAKSLVIFDKCPYGKKALVNSLASYFDLFISNPYPASMTTTPLYYRIIKANNLKVYNGDNEIVLNKDYAQSTISSLTIKEYTSAENSYLEYTVSRKENGDYIMGKTCTIKVEFPECLPQCMGCDKKGTVDDHRCFNCSNGYYPEEKGDDETGCGKNGKLYNCNNCDIACKECYGPFDDTIPTTNCRAEGEKHYCNTEGGYYPIELNYSTCFNESDKELWQEKLKLKNVLFLDKSGGEDPKTWVWRLCHEYCASCHLKNVTGNHNCDSCKVNEGWYFYFNQTEEKGIPGNCHPSCEGEGCYKCEVDDTQKMCPCLPYCKQCKGPDTCDECFATWLLHQEKTSCNKSCDYCYTPHFELEATKEKGRCVNCAEDFDPPKYTFNNKCIDELPFFYYKEYHNSIVNFTEVKKDYHVIDKFCNLITGCKKGCNKCSTLETDRCIECEEDYYMEDPFNVTRKRNWFYCFSKPVCQGYETYPYLQNVDEIMKVRGVPIIEGEEETKVCLNCRQRNDSWRLPFPNIFCGERPPRTWVEVPDYNGLSECYVRCKECDTWGSGCKMNCLSCRDSKYYDLIKYDKTHGQCYRKQHKCGIYPYYHNYELAVDEDDCGEDCDVCLYNFQCPKEFPYFKFETHECVEFCPMTDVLGGQCNVNTTAGILYLLTNPFGLRNPYDFLNNSLTIQEIISSQLFIYICKSYVFCNPDTIMKDIGNYIGNGKIYNLPERQVIIGNNISIELSSVKLELEKIQNYVIGNKVINNVIYMNGTQGTQSGEETDVGDGPKGPEGPTSGLNLSACEEILKKKYGLPSEEDLIVIKADFLEEFNVSMDDLNEYLGNTVNYQLFSTSLGAFLPLQSCIDAEEQVTVYNPFTGKSINQYQSKTGSVVSSGYDFFDAYSPFYNDICTPFTNEHGCDVLLDARRKDYYNENVNLCESGCIFTGYNTKSKTYTCLCNIKSEPGAEMGEYTGDVLERAMPKNFKNLISRRSNIAIFKCASQVFSSEGQNKNYGSYILLAGIASFVGVLVFFFVKERTKALTMKYDLLTKQTANPPGKNKKGEEKNKDEEKKEKEKGKTNKKSKIKGVDDKKKEKKDKKAQKNEEREKEGYPTFVRPVQNVNAQIDLVYEDDQLNFAPYNESCRKDTRSFLQTYWSFLKFKQSIIFTFYTASDGILRSTKIALFILFVGFYMAFTALFFNDKIMREIYIYKGNPSAAIHILNIVLSSICSSIAMIIVRYVCLNEREIHNVLRETNREERKKLAERASKIAAIKLYIFFAVAGLLMVLCWYYVSAFCAVFKNSQKNYLINFVVCFIICNLWPVVTSFIPTILRKRALKNNNETLYKVSQWVSIF